MTWARTRRGTNRPVAAVMPCPTPEFRAVPRKENDVVLLRNFRLGFVGLALGLRVDAVFQPTKLIHFDADRLAGLDTVIFVVGWDR